MATPPDGPETGSVSRRQSQPFATVVIDDRCTACGNCLVTCPPRALRRAPRKPFVIDDLCTGCGECIEVCPVDAITEVFA